jgi:hypothetical protein
MDAGISGLCSFMDMMNQVPNHAVQIAYLAMGLAIRQGGKQHCFALILCYFLIKEKVRA